MCTISSYKHGDVLQAPPFLRRLTAAQGFVPRNRFFAGWPSRPSFPARSQAPVRSPVGRPRAFFVRDRSARGPDGYLAASGQLEPHAGKRGWPRPCAPARDKRPPDSRRRAEIRDQAASSAPSTTAQAVSRPDPSGRRTPGLAERVRVKLDIGRPSLPDCSPARKLSPTPRARAFALDRG